MPPPLGYCGKVGIRPDWIEVEFAAEVVFSGIALYFKYYQNRLSRFQHVWVKICPHLLLGQWLIQLLGLYETVYN